MNKKAETKLLYNLFKEDIDRVMDYEYNHLTLADLLNSGVMDGMNPQELLEDIVGEWYNLKANHYIVNSEDRNDMITAIDTIERRKENERFTQNENK